ncbi:MAG: DUF2461 domain-containing protein [Atribacterota bacterium]|nr:DUF2461 domain-containing protein [Atribacterota bacterium]MDD4895313.1 DUF2461 domain-containing protein [Atribacterota bacterium]MDD5636738.1 DUF2461 domain-containing protein [Atribacterota bacterium]
MLVRKHSRFEGFSAETVFFLKNLKENNNREWFLARKKDYSKKVLQPASIFVAELGDMLQKISPGIQADPRVNRSICRIYQDARFSNDQNPYRPFLGLWFWQGIRRAKKSPGYYFELRPEQLYLSAGIQVFSRKALRYFREAIVDQASGEELWQIIDKIKGNQEYHISGNYYKNIPEGYQVSNDKLKDLIRFNGLLVYREMSIPPELYNRDLLKLVYNIYKDWSQLYNWITKYVYSEKQ